MPQPYLEPLYPGLIIEVICSILLMSLLLPQHLPKLVQRIQPETASRFRRLLFVRAGLTPSYSSV
jgi:hypothetical protein